MHARLATVRQLTQPAVQDVVIDAVVSGHGGDRHAVDAAGGHQLGLEFGAISATAAASLGELVVGVHVSTIFYVDTMLLDWRRHCQMGWPGAYVRASASNCAMKSVYRFGVMPHCLVCGTATVRLPGVS